MEAKFLVQSINPVERKIEKYKRSAGINETLKIEIDFIGSGNTTLISTGEIVAKVYKLLADEFSTEQHDDIINS